MQQPQFKPSTEIFLKETVEQSLRHTFPSAELIFPLLVLEYFFGDPLLSVTITAFKVPLISEHKFIFISLYFTDYRCKIKLV